MTVLVTNPNLTATPLSTTTGILWQTNEYSSTQVLEYRIIYIGQRRVVGLSFGSPLAAGAAGVLSVCVLLAAAAAGCRRGCVMLLSY